MRHDGSALILAPTDLAGFPECGQRTLLDRLKALGRATHPEYEDLRLDLIRERGMEHERAYLAVLRRDGKRIVEFEAPRGADWSDEAMRRRVGETLAAMRAGADVIYQGTLYDGRWRGLVDFLLRVERPSHLGGWSYEVADAKLAREAKASAILQTCVYSELLAALQGMEPESVHLFLGGPSPRLESFRLAHFGAYYRRLKGRFVEHLEQAGDEPPRAPEPVEACGVCDWKPRCDAERREADHLALVAGIRRDQREVLVQVGAGTLSALADLPLDPPPGGLRAGAYQRVREQARVQREGRLRGEHVVELLPLELPDPGSIEGSAPRPPSPPPTGLAALPAPHPHDLFLDLEGADQVASDGSGSGGGGADAGERDPDTGSTPGQGLEYLWGVSEVDDGYRGEWAFDQRAEREALLRFLRRAVHTLAEHPGAHIYHYGQYEPVALKRLVGRYGMGAEELDTLLERGAFVDLHRVVKQGIRASVESYSLKPMEEVVGFVRAVPLNEATRARIRVEVALASGARSRQELEGAPAREPGGVLTSPAARPVSVTAPTREPGGVHRASEGEPPSDLEIVEGYNRDDCVSLRALREWLEDRRRELEIREGRPIPRPPAPEPREQKEDDVAGEVRELMERLLDGVPDTRAERMSGWGGEGLPDAEVRWLLAHLLEWHRREDKTAWWEYFRWRDLSTEELVDEGRPLGGLVYEGVVGTVARSLLHLYRFPQQEHRFEAGDRGTDPRTEKARVIHALDEEAGTVVLKVGNNQAWEPRELAALLPDSVVATKHQRSRLRDSARRLLEGRGALREWSPASLALLERTWPRFGAAIRGAGGNGPAPAADDHAVLARDDGAVPAGDDRHVPAVDGAAGPLGTSSAPTGRVLLPAVAPGAPPTERAVEAVLRLAPGVLPVQGPPGTGKTYTGARMIRALLRSGMRVGITGPSHKVITNLLDAVCGASEGDGDTPVHGLQVKKDGEEGCTHPDVTRVDGSGAAPAAARAREEAGLPPFNLVAGTAWFWVTDDRERSVDVLFIDEAGQFSLANALAVAPAAPRLVLLGDPQQLNQPQKGVHPPGTEVSVLEHLAGEGGILAPRQGLFLEETWRMHPRITAFTSELFYEGKLGAREGLERQRIVTSGARSGGAKEELSGLWFLPVEHRGNSRESEEEAQAVAELFRRLLAPGVEFTDRHGVERDLVAGDLVVVAPYNAQVSRIRRALEGAGFSGDRVGTVDRFQGQEAPVAVYSLASSSAADAPRGMDFLFALDRLNVATSRARALTVVVASPALLEAGARHPGQMRMVNGLARFGELAEAR